MDRLKTNQFIIKKEKIIMTNTNILKQRKGESLQDYITRIKSMSDNEILEAAEAQRQQVLNNYSQNSKPTNYKRKVYHK